MFRGMEDMYRVSNVLYEPNIRWYSVQRCEYFQQYYGNFFNSTKFTLNGEQSFRAVAWPNGLSFSGARFVLVNSAGAPYRLQGIRMMDLA